MQKRSMFQKIFGGKQEPNSTSSCQMVNSPTSTFYAWSGNLFNSDIVRSCLRPKANAIGKLSAKHIVGFNENIKINSTPYIREILEQPNQFMSMQDFLMKMTNQRELNHNAFAYVRRDDLGCPMEIYPVPYSSVDLVESGNNVFVKFTFLMGRKMTVPYEDVIHLRKDFNSHDFFGDDGKIALDNIMNVITTTDQSIVTAIKNSAVIKWIMKFTSILRPEDKAKEIETFIKNYMDISNGSGVAATDSKFDITQVEDKSYVPNSSQMDKSIQRLYAYFGVNEKIVQNKWNEDDWNAFYESEIEPIAIQLSNAFTRAFFSCRERSFGNKIIFDSTNLACASMKTKLGLVAMVDRGAMTPNKWCEIMNLPPVEGGDVPIRRLDTAVVNSVNNDNGGNENGE